MEAAKVDLIPDEYDHADTSKACIVVFHGSEDERTKKLVVETFTSIGYSVPDANIHRLDYRKNVLEKIRDLSESAMLEECACLILLVFGNTGTNNGCISTDNKENILIQHIYNSFHVPSLVNKPRIFLFQTTASRFSIDGVITGQDPRYSVPAETDVFIAYKVVRKRGMFIDNICRCIQNFGRVHHLTDIVQHQNESPLMISTLSKNFYFLTSDKSKRGYHADMHDSLNDISETLVGMKGQFTKLQKYVSELRDGSREIKRTTSEQSLATSSPRPRRSSQSSVQKFGSNSSLGPPPSPRQRSSSFTRPAWR